MLEPMPPMERDASLILGEELDAPKVNGNGTTPSSSDLLADLGSDFNSTPAPSANNESSLLDLIGGGSLGNTSSITNSKPQPAPTSSTSNESSLLDLLGDLDFGGSKPSGNSSLPPMNDLTSGVNSGPATMPSNLLDGLMGGPINNSIGNSSSSPAVTAYDQDGVKVELHVVPGSSINNLSLRLEANSTTSISDFLFQAAVPKSMRLEMQPANADVGGQKVTQEMKVNNPTGAAVKMRIRLSYNGGLGAKPVQYQGEVSQFPGLS